MRAIINQDWPCSCTSDTFVRDFVELVVLMVVSRKIIQHELEAFLYRQYSGVSSHESFTPLITLWQYRTTLLPRR